MTDAQSARPMTKATRPLSEVTIDTIRALPTELQEALGMVAINQDGWVSLRLKRQLERRGLVEPYTDKVYGSGNTPIDRIPVEVTRYMVPLPVHMSWAAWCSEQVDGPRRHRQHPLKEG